MNTGMAKYFVISALALVILIAGAVALADVLKCDYCGKEIKGYYTESGGGKYHNHCYREHIALKCALCGEIIEGEYYIDFWGNNVHAYHRGQVPQCEYCRRFISDKISRGGKQYDDGRWVCGYCLDGAVNDALVAENVKRSILDKLSRTGIEIDAEDIPVYLVNRNTMTELAEGYHADPLGFTSYEKTSYGSGIVTVESFKIYMLTGLPRFEFASSLAHELMHVWLFNNAPLDIDPALREGSCNYAGYVAVKDYREKDAEFIVHNLLTDPDQIYGDGFRRVKKFVEANGIDYWLQYLQSHRYPPW